MAKYEKVFSLAPMLYTQGSPVIIEAGALHKDTTNSNIIAQLKFKSIINKDIKALTVELAPIDAFDNKIDEAVKHQYLDLKVKRNQEFASKEAIAMPNNSTRAFGIKSINVMFADGTNQAIENANWESLPTQKNLELKDYEKEYYLKKFNISNMFRVEPHKDLWLCSCGNVNNENEEDCFKCGNKKSELIDTEAFENNALKFKAEKEEKIKKETEEKQIKTSQEAKKKRIAIILVVTITVFAIVVGIVSSNLHKAKMYEHGIQLVSDKQYEQAYEMLKGLDNYKDANVYLSTCHIHNKYDYRLSKEDLFFKDDVIPIKNDIETNYSNSPDAEQYIAYCNALLSDNVDDLLENLQKANGLFDSNQKIDFVKSIQNKVGNYKATPENTTVVHPDFVDNGDNGKLQYINMSGSVSFDSFTPDSISLKVVLKFDRKLCYNNSVSKDKAIVGRVTYTYDGDVLMGVLDNSGKITASDTDNIVFKTDKENFVFLLNSEDNKNNKVTLTK